MIDTQYLLLRGHSWVFKIAIPIKLRKHFPTRGHGLQNHIIRPLKTRDIEEARRLRWGFVAEYKMMFHLLANPPDTFLPPEVPHDPE